MDRAPSCWRCIGCERLGRRLRANGAPLGEVFAWLSALYLRGKLAYADVFGRRGRAFVIAPSLGLVEPHTRITPADLRAMAATDVEDDRFQQLLHAHAIALRDRVPKRTQAVLLGSIATTKYARVLLDVFGRRLQFPSAFVGRGDMSRGGLLLRAARSGTPLGYAPLAGAVVRGPRPPRLPRARSQPTL